MIKFELFTHGVLDERDSLTEKAAFDLMKTTFERLVPDPDDALKQYQDALSTLLSGQGIEIENKPADTVMKFTPNTRANARDERSVG